ncbi:hypothetical protein BS47DRAFT_562601 [Hydnum rufescens UP504]|uniref:Uncharacterized protein n=1 Tax=Hydnum rufescens UP504 TaxID=1448309 RepID=A0A9P6DII1_9AGAM|nr:hypothetical protein BS47DRAFT_562601 [Hydnum rufescens UP504]
MRCQGVGLPRRDISIERRVNTFNLAIVDGGFVIVASAPEETARSLEYRDLQTFNIYIVIPRAYQ